jgi:hypothetical protein
MKKQMKIWLENKIFDYFKTLSEEMVIPCVTGVKND